MSADADSTTKTRRRAMSILARADAAELDAALNAIEPPAYNEIRRPEIGLVMLRGRISGSGAPFNIGEATVTRAAVRLESGVVGVSYVLGRDDAKARNAALIDALVQTDGWREHIEREILAPVERRLATQDAKLAAQTAATRVDFFTMVRGED